MPRQQVLVLAMTRMRTGICVAGMMPEPDPVAGLRWVRPVREYETLLPGDMTTADGKLVACGDVIELDLIAPRPNPPHVEDWFVNWAHRPRILRRLEGKRRRQFFSQHLDRSPIDVLVHHTRSLCLIEPRDVSAHFSLDAYSHKYQARMSFVLDKPCGTHHNVAVTDVKWRALGRSWLGHQGGEIELGLDALRERLQAEKIYLALGLSRSWQGRYWTLVVGVHVVPDYYAETDPKHL